MENQITEMAPRERKIRRGIVLLSSSQVALGAVIIGMSFTAFASTSSPRIRGSSPYWAGFMALFTGSVGFLTWKQLSIVSIGIYTFLSTACVVVSLVATVLTGDSAGFLKTLVYCTEVKFEHACQCCIKNTTCTSPYKFQSMRDCSIVNGFLKDILYGLCVANVLCCVMSLTVTLVGCTLGAQYTRYTQNCAFRWSQPPPQPSYDHRYNWLPYPVDPIGNLPPRAPPVYSHVRNTSRALGYHFRRPPPVLFDSIDFPPPYTSREPSIAGQRTSQGSLEYTLGHQEISWDALDPSAARFFTQGAVSEDSFDYIDRTDDRVLGSSTGTSEGMLNHGNSHEVVMGGTSDSVNIDDDSLTQSHVAHLDRVLPSSSTDSDSETPHDAEFVSREACTVTRGGLEQDYVNNHPAQTNVRRHSWAPRIRSTQSSDVYSTIDEIYHARGLWNINPWSQSLSEVEPQRDTENRNLAARHLVAIKPRSNSSPCHMTQECSIDDVDVAVACIEDDLKTITRELNGTTQVDTLIPSPIEAVESCTGGLFRHFTESASKTPRSRIIKKRRRPRHNPGHILEHDSSGQKEVSAQDISNLGIDSSCTEYRETTL